LVSVSELVQYDVAVRPGQHNFVMSVDAGHHGIGLYVDMGETGRLDDDGLSGEPGSQTGRRTDLTGPKRPRRTAAELGDVSSSAATDENFLVEVFLKHVDQFAVDESDAAAVPGSSHT